MHKTSLSVILPTRNRGELLAAPLDSLCDQLEEGDELVVSINGEISETTRLLERYRDRISPAVLKIIVPESELPIYQHWEFAIKNANNPWVIFLHDDETYHRSLVKIVKDELSKDSRLTLITAGTVNVEVGSNTKTWIKNRFNMRRLIDGNDWLDEQIGFGRLNYGSTCYIFKKAEEYSFLANETRVSDILLMISQAINGQVLELPEILGTHLLHGSNQSWTDYLTPGQVPFWQGLQEMGEKFKNQSVLKYAEIERKNAYRLYLRNALLVALPRRDRRAFSDCLRFASESQSQNDIKLKMAKILQFQPFFYSSGILLSLIKKLKGPKKFGLNVDDSSILSNHEVQRELGMSENDWTGFEEMASAFSASIKNI